MQLPTEVLSVTSPLAKVEKARRATPVVRVNAGFSLLEWGTR